MPSSGKSKMQLVVALLLCLVFSIEAISSQLRAPATVQGWFAEGRAVTTGQVRCATTIATARAAWALAAVAAAGTTTTATAVTRCALLRIKKQRKLKSKTVSSQRENKVLCS